MLHLDDATKTLEFEKGGKKYSMPLQGSLPAAINRKFAVLAKIEDDAARNAASIDLQFDILEKYAPGLSDKISMNEFNTIWDEWMRESGITLGESSASAD